MSSIPPPASPASAEEDHPGWSLGGRKLAAWLALVALVALIVRFAILAVTNVVETIGVLLALALLGIGLWWALTGREVRAKVGIVVVVVGVAALLVALISLATSAPRAVLGIAGWLIAFAFFSARALGLQSRARRWRENRVALPASAAAPSVDLPRLTVPTGLIVNEKSGDGKAAQIELAARAREMGVTVELLEPGRELREMAEWLIAGGARIIGMAGGDGSLGIVADVAMAHDVPFVCIPVGTRNHFARDLGLDRSDPLSALAAYDGEELRVDVARINDERTFLNNATFGIYADMVHEPGYRESKLVTAQSVVSDIVNGDRDPTALQFESPDGTSFTSAFLIMVAVGPYSMDSLGDLGVRSAMDSGLLQVSVLEPADEASLRRITTAALLRNVENQDGFWQWTAPRFEVADPDEEINVGVDGEALTFPSPVAVVVHPGALRVLVPPGVKAVPGPQGQPLGVTVADLWRLATATE